MSEPFVPSQFVVPEPLGTADFVFEPLSPEHNDIDYEAWTTSVDHISATPGFAGWGWPHPMSPEENRGDLQRHHDDFEARTGFTYAVFDEAHENYVGCVYLYPARDEGNDVQVRSWVRADHAHLDEPLYRAVSTWLAERWPWRAPSYAPR